MSLFINSTGNIVESMGSLVLSALDRVLLPNANFASLQTQTIPAN